MYTDLIKGLLEKEGMEKADAWVKDIPLGMSSTRLLFYRTNQNAMGCKISHS